MGKMRLRLGLIALCVGLPLGVSLGNDAGTPGQVAQAWAEREKRVKSCRVVWSERATYPKGSPYIAPLAKPEEVPTTDVTISATCKMVIDANKSRYEYQGQMWSTKNKKLEPAADVVIFDGNRLARTSLQSALVGNPQVTIKKEATSPQSRLPLLLPIWLTVRPSVAQKRIPVEQFVTTGRKEKIGDRLCTEFTRPVQGGREQVFIDLERNAQVTRYVDSWDDKLHLKLEISYRSDAVLGWVPTAWEFVLCNRKGSIDLSVRCTASEFTANVDVPASDFEPVLPAGARVIDDTSGKEIHYGILPGGERGMGIEFVPGKSEFPTHEALMAQPPERTPWEKAWPWALACVGVVSLGGLVAWRLRRRGAPPESI